jgi:hypothetical protein
MKRPSRHAGLGLACLLVVAAACGEGNGNTRVNPTPTDTPSVTATPTSTATSSATITVTPTSTSPPTATVTFSPTSTSLPTVTETSTPVPTPTPTALPGVEMAGRLDLDIRWSADVVIRVVEKDVFARVTLGDARAVAVAGVALDGVGRVHDFPEADAVLYAARLTSPPLTDGRCGSQPTSLALTLFRRGGNDHVAGGIAVYCGADTYSGVPARMLRLAGVLPAK